MSKIRHFCTMGIIGLFLFLFVGCSARTVISANEFQSQAKSSGFTVTANSSDESGAQKSLTATKDGTDVQINFYEFADASASQTWYTAQKAQLGTAGKTVVDSDAYNKYSVQNGDFSYIAVRMDKTAILCKTVASKKSVAEDFLKKIKY